MSTRVRGFFNEELKKKIKGPDLFKLKNKNNNLLLNSLKMFRLNIK